MKIYTKTGDKGTTSLFGGKRIDKDSLRIEAYGTVDELNSLIGVILSGYSSSKSEGRVEKLSRSSQPIRETQSKQVRTIRNMLFRVQSELFVLGTDLATPKDARVKVKRVNKPMIDKLEREIDDIDKDLPKLKNFILPGGGRVGAKLHLARTITRRAERSMVALSKQERINPFALSYINRLSDWLFVFARFVNKIDGAGETIWKGRGK